ncbi:MAG TPA: nuclear transport factor 2 family protein [Acidobacteriota bacterium]
MNKAILSVLALAVLFGFGISDQTAAIPEADKAAILETARDYGDGFYAGEPERMERAIHPDLNKIVTQVLPQTGGVLIGYSTFSGLIELTRAKVGLTTPLRKIQPEALLMNEDIACAKLTSPGFNDYLQMVKIEGGWKIVNVLWVPGPETPGLQPLTGFDPEKEKDAAKKAAFDFVEGSLSGDVIRVEAALHPEVSRAVFQKQPQTGKARISRQRYSGLVEPIRAKMGIVPEDQRKVDVQIIDMMDGMAFVHASTAFGDSYIQMSWLNKQWKILNILVKPKPGAPRAPQR